MKYKYYQERFKAYIVFGEDGDLVDLADSEGDVVTKIKRSEAERIIKDRDELFEMLIKLGDALEEINPGKFNEIWHNLNLINKG